MTPSKPPPHYEQLLPLPTPCFKMFWEDPLMTSPPSFSLKAICCSNFVHSSSFTDDHSVLRILFSNSFCSHMDLFSSFIDSSRFTSSIGSALSYSSSKPITSIFTASAISVICYIYMPENLYPKLPSAPSTSQLPSALSISQGSFNVETIRKYHQAITDLRNKCHEKQLKYKNSHNKLLHASTGASSGGVISGVSTIGTAFIVVGLPISASLGAVSTVSACIGGILLLSSKKYKKKLLTCYELLDKITSSLATFVIDAKEFHKLQTLYLQLMTYVRNIDRKMRVQTEENFQKTITDEIKN